MVESRTRRGDAAMPASAAAPGFAEALKVWFRIGCLSFGGPAGQIAMMHRVVVEQKKWIDEARFLHALNYCMLLPGPEAMQLAAYIGWLMHGTRGGLAAGLLFVLPGALVMLVLSMIYVLGRDIAVIEGALFGIKAAVLVIVVEAIVRIGRRALKSQLLIGLSAAAFIAIFFFELPFPIIVIGAALIGIAVARSRPGLFNLSAQSDRRAGDRGGRMRQSALAASAGLIVWWAPVALAAGVLGADHILVSLGLFFSKLAVVSFGGAYALMAYMAQQVVEAEGWLQLSEMVDGLGLAETTPGPLILVSQFVGFLAAFRAPEPFTPLTGAIFGAAMTTWTIFAPSFLFIFAGAPFIEELRGNRRLAGALAAITAAVVGVILNLAVWFTIHVLFHRVEEMHTGVLRWFKLDLASLDARAAVLTAIAAGLMFGAHLGLVATVGVMAALGIGARLVFA